MGAEGKGREHFMRSFPPEGLDNINDLFVRGSLTMKNVTLIKLPSVSPTFSQVREGVKSSGYLNLSSSFLILFLHTGVSQHYCVFLILGVTHSRFPASVTTVRPCSLTFCCEQSGISNLQDFGLLISNLD